MVVLIIIYKPSPARFLIEVGGGINGSYNNSLLTFASQVPD